MRNQSKPEGIYDDQIAPFAGFNTSVVQPEYAVFLLS